MLCGSAPIAFHIHLEDGRVVNKPVDGGQGHGRIREDGIPFAEGLVGGDQHGAALISCADDFEQDAGLRLIFGDIGDVVEDQQMELVELCDGAF